MDQGETKYFNSLQAWRIEAVAQVSRPAPREENLTQNTTAEVKEEDNLPF